MITRRSIVPILSLLAITALLAVGIGKAPSTEATAQSTFADPLFQQQWEYSDKPVQNGVSRSWIWGPPGEVSLVDYETALASPAKGIPQDKLLVQYFDKARMEYAVSNSNPPTVTNGRLVVEMMTGLIEVGRNKYLHTIPSGKPIAGDTQSNARHANTSTYATLYSVASQGVGGSAPLAPEMPLGTTFTRSLDRFGNVDQAPLPVRDKARAVGYKDYPCTDANKRQIRCGQNIPDVFLNFLNQSGQVYKDGSYQQGQVFDDWVKAVGLPITEPYWTQINISGKEYWVLFQAFERRVLTYNPANLPPWNVEMGNVGQHYRDWRNSKPDPKDVLVIQATSGSTTEVCSRYLQTNNTQCDGKSYEPEPSITMLQPGSWASTKEKGRMVLESASTIFQLRQSAKLSFKAIRDDITEAVHGGGGIDFIHDPTKPPLTVAIGQWKVESVHSLFSVVVTEVVEGQPSFFVAVPSFGGSVRVLRESPNPDVRLDVTVPAGSQLIILVGKPGKVEPISPQEEAYWKSVRDALANVPSLRDIAKSNHDAFP